MKHITFTLKGEKMQIFESFPFTIITDADGTELVYIRCQARDDAWCDVVYCSMFVYQYANWSLSELEKWVNDYCRKTLGRRVNTIQHTVHIILPTVCISEWVYEANGLQKLTI